MKITNTLFTIMVAVVLSACASPYVAITDTDTDTGNTVINLLPMYGYPDIEKTGDQKKADQRFIDTVSRSTGSRKNASREFAGRGWYFIQQRDYDNAMRRLNQSWLLDSDFYLPHWGFAVVLNMQNKPAKAIPHFKKATSLLEGTHSDKPRLLADMATAYVALGRHTHTTDTGKSEELLRKAKILANEVFRLDPEFGNEAIRRNSLFASAYRYGDSVARSELSTAFVARSNGDYATALREYRLLAERDVVQALVSLAEMYRDGEGVDQDYAEAARWYRRAAEQGNASAQKSLGTMYSNGMGVAKDLVNAYMWYHIASTSGHEGATRSRDYIAKQMTAARIAEAQELARAWMDKHP